MPDGQYQGNVRSPAVSNQGYLAQAQSRHAAHYIFGYGHKIVAVIRLAALPMPTLIKGNNQVMRTKVRSYQPPGISGGAEAM